MKNIYKISVVLFIGLSLIVSSCKKEEADLLGCTDSTALNYNSLANTDNGSCILVTLGCTSDLAFNYDSLANTDDGSCVAEVIGCMDSTAFNYNSSANTNDQLSCIPVILGCMDVNSFNFIPLTGDSFIDINTEDYSCIYAQEIAIGVWGINPDCDEIDILGQVILLNDQLPDSVDVQGNEEEKLFIYIGETQVSATIDNFGSITVPEQTASIDAGFGFPIPVQIDGSGKIESDISGYMNLTFSGEFEIIQGLPPTSFSSTCDITLSK